MLDDTTILLILLKLNNMADPLIAAGAGLAGQLINVGGSIFTNRANRRHAHDMYDKMRADALADRAFENQYNSPAAQMERLKAAGLNPNLVYGNGPTTEGSSTRSTQAPAYQGEAPQVNMDFVGRAIDAMNQQKLLQSQIKLNEANEELATYKAITELHNADLTHANARGKELFNELNNQTLSEQIEKKKLDNQKLQADIKYTLDQNERSAALNASNIREAAERIIQMRIQNAKTAQETANLKQQLQLLKHDERVKAFEADLADRDLSKNDFAPLRMLLQSLSQLSQHLYDSKKPNEVKMSSRIIFIKRS